MEISSLLKGMDSGQNQNYSEAHRSFSGEPLDGNGNDVTTRRMKNRERQRRYRARKRLEADSTTTRPPLLLLTNSTPTPEEERDVIMDPEPIAVVHREWTPRVHSRRDWKKDARKAVASSTSDSQSSSSGLTSGPKSEMLVDGESVDRVNSGTTTGRRDWKAEARTRKS